jgi:hypothetical protein
MATTSMCKAQTITSALSSLQVVCQSLLMVVRDSRVMTCVRVMIELSELKAISR